MAGNGSARVSRSGDGGGEQENHRDRISELPDSILHLILVLVPLVDAVRTCVLSRRWRAVWTRLPVIFLDDAQLPRASPSRFPGLVDGVLRGCTAAADADDGVGMEDLFVAVHRSDSVAVADADGGGGPVRFAAALADLAAQRISGRFGIYLSPDAVNLYCDDDDDAEDSDSDSDSADDDEAAAPPPPPALQLPCFPRATELSITFMGVHLRMPSADAGTFARLTKLYISGARFGDGGSGISEVVSLRCPCIQVLELHRVVGLLRLTVLAQTLVSMVLSRILSLEQLLVVAGSLRHMLVHKCFVLSNARGFMFLGVPALEQLLWQDRCPEVIRHWDDVLPRCLRRLVVAELDIGHLIGAGGWSNFRKILQIFKCVDTLRLEFPYAQDRTDEENLIENIRLPCYSELEFMVNHTRHKFGPTVLNLLRKCTCVRKVTLQIFGREVGYMPCAPNCNCRQLSVWTDNTIALDSLEWVAMYEFMATQDEMSFIYYIMRNARRLRKVQILFSLGANPTKRFFRKLRKLLSASSSGCTVYFYSH